MKLLSWIVVASLLFRGLIPAGYMPNTANPGHFFQMVICTANGVQTIAVDENGQPAKQPPEDHQQKKAHKACPFALAAHATTPPADPMLQPIGAADYTTVLFTAPATRLATTTLRKSAPPRAPPLFS
jgi:hypothetical protein